MFSRARWRLTLWFAGAFAVILVVIGTSVYFSARQSIMGQVRDDLHQQSDAVVAAQQIDNETPGDLRPEIILRVLSASGSFWVVVDTNGKVAFNSSAIEPTNLNLPSANDLSRSGSAVTYHRTSTNNGEQITIVSRPVQYVQAGLLKTGYLEIGRSIEPQLKSLRQLLVILFGGGAIGLILAAAGGYWLSGRALKPIKVSLEQQRAFVADASHELRTPLSLIRANAEMMQRHSGAPPDPMFVEDIIKETDRLAYLVSQLLTLARSDSADAPFDKEPVDMNQLTSDISRQMKMLADEKQIAVKVETNGAAIVEGDEQRLGELLLILMDNSIKYTNAGGEVDVSVNRENGRVQVAVADNGVGIPQESLPHVFERFYRVDKARSREMGGSGLGLAIARWIADQHDARISIDSKPGAGTKVTLDLPAVSPV